MSETKEGQDISPAEFEGRLYVLEHLTMAAVTGLILMKIRQDGPQAAQVAIAEMGAALGQGLETLRPEARGAAAHYSNTLMSAIDDCYQAMALATTPLQDSRSN